MREQPLTDEQLVEQVVSGDERAMRELYDRYSPLLYGICLRYMGNEDDAKDALQEAFIKIFRSIDHFQHRGHGSLRAWLSRIATNESLNALESQRHRLEVYVDDPSLLPEVAVAEEDDTSPLQVPQAALLEMIASLPEGYRTVFNLFVFEELSHREIAQQLGITESASASQYHRARHALQRMISAYISRHDYET